MAKIETGRFSELMRRYLSLAGVVEVTQELAPEISSVFVLEQERPDWEFLKGSKLCSAVFTVTAVAGLASTGRLRNPAASGVVATISKIFASSDQTSVFNVLRNTLGDLAVVFPGVPVTRDTRWPPVSSALIMSGANVAGVGDNMANGIIASNQPAVVFEVPMILTPGNAIDIHFQTLNVTMRGTVIYLERPLPALENA